MIDVKLTPGQIVRCVEWTAAKQDYKQAHAVADQWYDRNSTSRAVDLMGRLGEVAGAQALGLDWQEALDWAITPGGDSGIDMTAHGLRWDVKTTAKEALIFNSPFHFKADAALLVQLLGDRAVPDAPDATYRVWGVCSRERFLQTMEDRTYAGRNRVAVDAGQMMPVAEFLKWVKRWG